jgi:hypothetical protein
MWELHQLHFFEDLVTVLPKQAQSGLCAVCEYLPAQSMWACLPSPGSGKQQQWLCRWLHFHVCVGSL